MFGRSRKSEPVVLSQGLMLAHNAANAALELFARERVELKDCTIAKEAFSAVPDERGRYALILSVSGHFAKIADENSWRSFKAELYLWLHPQGLVAPIIAYPAVHTLWVDSDKYRVEWESARKLKFQAWNDEIIDGAWHHSDDMLRPGKPE